jgi:hypothetical protein
MYTPGTVILIAHSCDNLSQREEPVSRQTNTSGNRNATLFSLDLPA